MRRFVMAAVLVQAALGVSGRARAASITYTETFTASGTLDGVGFTIATVQLQGIGDTANVQSPGTEQFIHVPITVTIGGQVDTIQDPNTVFILDPSHNLFEAGSFVFGTLVGSTDPVFATYNLTAALPTTSTTLTLSPDPDPFPTVSGKSLIFTSGAGPVIVSVTGGVVPEPATFVMAGMGLLATIGLARRQSGRATLAA